MCGRFAIKSPPEILRQLLNYRDQPNFPPRYNVAPTQPIPVVRIDGGARRFALLRWGLLPAWVKDPKAFTLKKASMWLSSAQVADAPADRINRPTICDAFAPTVPVRSSKRAEGSSNERSIP